MKNKISTQRKERGMSLFKTILISLKKVATYGRNSIISAIIDVSIFTVFLYFTKPILGTGSAIVIAGVTARILSSLVNFFLNKSLFTGDNISRRGSMVRYYILWTTLLTLSVSMTYLLNDIFQVTEVLSKIISDMSLGVLSYQVQLRWVFKNKLDETTNRTRGLYFRVVQKTLRLFMKREVRIDEEIFAKENVLVGHHQNFYGPISCLLWLPDTVNIWVISHLFNFKECFNMYYNHTFKKTIKLPRIIALIPSTFCALFIPPVLRSARAVPVYRDSREIIKTFNQSIELLNRGDQILIFPDIQYNNTSPIMGEISKGFTHLEKLYYKSKGEHLGFVPIIIDRTTGIIRNTSTIYFDDDNSYKVGRDILVNQIVHNINLEYL